MARLDPIRSVLVWHVHGSWMESFVAGPHRYVVPFSGGELARGLCGRDWPNAVEVATQDLAAQDVDLVVLQKPEELELTERWLGRRPGVDVPAIYLEHNAPRPSAVDSLHPIGARSDLPLVHVTDFNRLIERKHVIHRQFLQCVGRCETGRRGPDANSAEIDRAASCFAAVHGGSCSEWASKSSTRVTK